MDDTKYDIVQLLNSAAAYSHMDVYHRLKALQMRLGREDHEAWDVLIESASHHYLEARRRGRDLPDALKPQEMRDEQRG